MKMQVKVDMTVQIDTEYFKVGDKGFKKPLWLAIAKSLEQAGINGPPGKGCVLGEIKLERITKAPRKPKREPIKLDPPGTRYFYVYAKNNLTFRQIHRVLPGEKFPCLDIDVLNEDLHRLVDEENVYGDDGIEIRALYECNGVGQALPKTPDPKP